MQHINLCEAKKTFSELMGAIESGKESEIMICRRGKPVVKLVKAVNQPVGQRIGVARHFSFVLESHQHDDEIEQLFR